MYIFEIHTDNSTMDHYRNLGNATEKEERGQRKRKESS
jgi:hypothetical protein